ARIQNPSRDERIKKIYCLDLLRTINISKDIPVSHVVFRSYFSIPNTPLISVISQGESKEEGMLSSDHIRKAIIAGVRHHETRTLLEELVGGKEKWDAFSERVEILVKVFEKNSDLAAEAARKGDVVLYERAAGVALAEYEIHQA